MQSGDFPAFGICSRRRRERFPAWDLFSTVSRSFPALGFALDGVEKFSSVGICSRQRREGFVVVRFALDSVEKVS